MRPLGLNAVRKQVEIMELETKRFYDTATRGATDAQHPAACSATWPRRNASTRALAEQLEAERRDSGALQDEAATRKRLFMLQVIQPGLAGLMDGSVSTLAPLFATAIATAESFHAFLVGMAASVGAGISMGFAEALSDDGSLTGRGRPWTRGFVCGLMTSLGGLGHTLPFLIPHLHWALIVAIVVVVIELGVITWVRHSYMETPLGSAILQIAVGGILVFLTGIFIGEGGQVDPEK